MFKSHRASHFHAAGHALRFQVGLILAVGLAVAIQERICIQTASAATLSLNFGNAVGGTIADATGQGTGLPTRLSGTGTAYSGNDSNLTLNTGAHTLTIAPTTAADFNGGTIASMEALGVQLSSLGYTGSQDFSVSASFVFPAGASADFNQFGVYVGATGSAVTRDGFVFVSSVSGQNAYSSIDNSAPPASDVGTVFSAQAFHVGDTIVATMTRVGGAFTETVADTTAGNAFSANVTPPTGLAFLNSFSDLNVGLYATETSGNLFSVQVTSFTATVVTPEPSSIALLGVALAGLLAAGVRGRRNSLLGAANRNG